MEISEKSNLNFIQLHGDEDEEFVKKLRLSLSKNIKIIKVIRIGNDFEKFKNEISKISNLKSQIYCSTQTAKLLAEQEKPLIGKFSTK